MKFRIVASLLLLAALVMVALAMQPSERESVQQQAAPAADDGLKNLKIN